ncbi:hypothetical protein Tco_0426205 [Tanacetum coccineum]
MKNHKCFAVRKIIACTTSSCQRDVDQVEKNPVILSALKRICKEVELGLLFLNREGQIMIITIKIEVERDSVSSDENTRQSNVDAIGLDANMALPNRICNVEKETTDS